MGNFCYQIVTKKTEKSTKSTIQEKIKILPKYPSSELQQFLLNESFEISKIKNDLYLSNYEASQNYDLLSKLGIEQILTVGNDLKHCDCSFNQCDVDCSFNQKFKLMHILIDDDETEDIFQYFDQTHAFLKDKPTLVHCYAGISRSSTIVIAHLMKEYDMSYFSAFKLCKEKRSIICPNSGFQKQLQQYEESINKQKTLHCNHT